MTPFARVRPPSNLRLAPPAALVWLSLLALASCASSSPPNADGSVPHDALVPADDPTPSAPSPVPEASVERETTATSAADPQPPARRNGSAPTARTPGPPSAPPGPARLRSTRLRETSGLAVSRRDPAVLWAINDSGNAPLLHALTRRGKRLGEWPVAVARARDWEDLAAFELDGVPHLAIADTGDNLRDHDDYALHLVAEPVARGPDAAPGTALVPGRSIRFRLDDGPHDVESLGIDADGTTAWLLVKAPARRGGTSAGGGVYTLPLVEAVPDGRGDDAREIGGEPFDEKEERRGTSGEREIDVRGSDDRPSAGRSAAPDGSRREDSLGTRARTVRIARRVGTLAPVPRSLEARLAARLAGVDLEQPTAFDIAADGRRACLLTYRRVRCFSRGATETWDDVLSRPGRTLVTHALEQAEALALSADGLVWFTSEGVSPPLRALPLRPVSP